MKRTDPRPTGRRARAGYVVVVHTKVINDPTICIDCIRCGATICEATPETLAAIPRRLGGALVMHEATHPQGAELVEVVE